MRGLVHYGQPRDSSFQALQKSANNYSVFCTWVCRRTFTQVISKMWTWLVITCGFQLWAAFNGQPAIKCGWETTLNIINVGSFMHSFLNGKLSKTFNSMFKINYNVHSYGTRRAALFHTPVGRTAFSYKTIKFKGVSIYNNISAKINTTCSIAALKAQHKQLLLRGDTF